MHGGPRAGRIVAVGHVKRRRERPFALLVHQKGDVLHVVVLIPRDDVENHLPPQSARSALLFVSRFHAITALEYIRTSIVYNILSLYSQ